MKTQSPDTSLDAELALIGMIRKAPITRRFALTQAWTTSMLEAGSQYMQQLHPGASDEEARLLFIERQYGEALSSELRQVLQSYNIPIANVPNYWEAISPLARILEDLSIPYALFGSLACSRYGLQRATLQIDFVADLCQKHLSVLYSYLDGQYLLHSEEVEAAIRQQTRVTLVHLESLLKVEITLPGLLVTGKQVVHRVRQVSVIENQPAISVLRPEDVIVLLLDAFKKSNERADDLWYDLLGVLKVQASDLDTGFLAQQSLILGVTELLERALADAGLTDMFF